MRFAARKLTGTLEQFFLVIFTKTFRNIRTVFSQLTLEYSKQKQNKTKTKQKALLDFQIIVNPGGGKC